MSKVTKLAVARRKLHTFLLIASSTVLLSCFVPAVSFAQAPTPADNKPPGQVTNIPPIASAEEASELTNLMTSREFLLSLLILVFGVIIIVIQYMLLRGVVKQRTDVTSRAYTITLIIVGTMFLITAGYNSDQISPAMALFGTIAGYLLGRIEQQTTPKPEENDK